LNDLLQKVKSQYPKSPEYKMMYGWLVYNNSQISLAK